VTLAIATHADRPELGEACEEWYGSVWPEFMLHDAVCKRLWGHLDDDFPTFQLYLLDGSEVVGFGNTIPFAWDGAPERLPGGVDGVLERGVAGLARGLPATTLSALLAVVRPDRRGGGLSARLIEGMREIGRASGLSGLVAPVRPTLKATYPLTPIDAYSGWRREDGLLFDPWLRVHARLGAEVLGIAAESLTVAGTVEEWERWAGMAFPASGEYVVPGALVPVTIDRDLDSGLYVEPNIWMQHAS
jgi:GNAT superfamily N-acetyltransferase